MPPLPSVRAFGETTDSHFQICLAQRDTASGSPVLLIQTGLILPVARRSRTFMGGELQLQFLVPDRAGEKRERGTAGGSQGRHHRHYGQTGKCCQTEEMLQRKQEVAVVRN
jgi:hypothetical protein